MGGAALGSWDWVVLLAAAVILGIAKGGLPAASILAIPLISVAIPGKAATGLMLPLLLVGDLFGLAYWRRSASWKELLRSLPWAAAGIAAGALALGRIDDGAMRPVIGGIVLLLLGVHLVRGRLARGRGRPSPPGRDRGGAVAAAAMGSLGGFTTMLANAGGAVMGMYFLALGLSKETFIGTTAWFFFVVNLIKLPIMVGLGMITPDGLLVNLALVPALAAGTAAGIFLARKLDQKVFDALIAVLTAAACLRLMV